jgi:dipeptidyl aminopeptidase/acylaminoacyl peptidase
MPIKKRPITAEDLYRFQLITHCEISPDGEHVVYSLQRVDRKSEKKYSNLWIVPTRGGAPQQFTFGDQVDTLPKWSPDGQTIAFLSNRGDEKQSQIYLIPFHGGEARPLTKLKGTIGNFAWSPDGRQLVIEFRQKDPEALEREKDENKKKLGVVERHITRLFYKLDGEGYLPKERWHIWTVNARTGRAKQLISGDIYDEYSPSWSPDGKQIVFCSNRAPDPDLEPDAVDLFIIPASGGDLQKLETPYGPKNLPTYSPDGQWIAYVGREGKSNWWKNLGLWVMPVDGSQPATNLTARYDLHVDAYTINDLGSPTMMPPTWSPDSQRLYFQAVQHGSTVLKSVDRQGNDLQTVVEGPGVVGAYSFDNQHQRLAYFFGQMEDPGQVWVKELSNGKARPLTKINQRLLRRLDLGQVEEVWFKGPAGNDLQGWILKPPGFDPKKKYPSILEIHGGPLVQYGYFFMHEFYFLAANGYVVTFCNPRGGRGYGEQHGKAIWKDWGSADYADLMAWADYMEKLPYIDLERMGVTGGSYGGYMTTWIIGHTDRFKAAVTQRQVSNFIDFWGSTDFNWIWQEVLSDKPPWEDLEKFWQHSPMKYIGNAKTPTLVIHSEKDYRCPIAQGEQVFVALKSLGVDTEMVHFPDEPHGLSRTGRTDRRIARLKHILRWFDKYLKDEPSAN